MNGRRLAVALVGCGRIAVVHQQYLSTIREAELVAVCDADPDARSRMSARAIVPAYDSVEQMLRCAAPEVVHVLTPPSTHAEIGRQVLGSGAHALIEKPLALSVADADLLLAAARKRGVYVTADHNRWFDPVMQRLRGMIESNALGEVVGIEVFQGAVASTEAAQSWKTQLPGGPLHDVAPHALYCLRHLLGPLEVVDVLTERDLEGQVIEARLLARGAGSAGVVTLSMRARPADHRVRVLGTLATAEVNLNHMTLLVHREHHSSKITGKVLPNLDSSRQLVRETFRNGVDFLRGRQRFYPGIGEHLRELYGRLSRGLPPPVSGEEARDVVALCERVLYAGSEEIPSRAAVGT